MNLAKKALILSFSLIFLFTPALIHICLATELLLTKAGSNSYSFEESHPHHHQTTCRNKVSCEDNYCCNLITEDAGSYFFGLDFHSLNAVETSSRPLEITKFFYHPPRILS